MTRSTHVAEIATMKIRLNPPVGLSIDRDYAPFALIRTRRSFLWRYGGDKPSSLFGYSRKLDCTTFAYTLMRSVSEHNFTRVHQRVVISSNLWCKIVTSRDDHDSARIPPPWTLDAKTRASMVPVDRTGYAVVQYNSGRCWEGIGCFYNLALCEIIMILLTQQ